MHWLIKLLIFIVMLLNMISCSTTSEYNKKDVEWKRNSFVKFETWIDRNACTKKKTEDCIHKKIVGYTGSGATVATAFDGSYILTAAHMCSRKNDIKRLEAEDEAYERKAKYKLHFSVRDIDDYAYKAEIVKFNRESDICIAFVWGLFNPPLVVANEAPEVGETYYNMAAPAGYFRPQLVPLFEGRYVGVDERAAVYTIPAIGGSSGSPIINRKGELVGMVYARHIKFHHITISPSFKKLRKFIFSSVKKHARKKAKELSDERRRQIIINFKK